MVPSLENLLNSESVPRLPESVLRVLQIARQAEPNPEQILKVILRDPVLSARVLKTAANSDFAVRYIADSIEAAVSLLGISYVRMLVLAFELGAHRGTPSHDGRIWNQRIWRQVLTQAAAAETLAQHVAGADAANWLLAGLLQDLGRLIMLDAAQDQYLRDVLYVETETSLEEREQLAFGFSHVDVSLGLCRRWNLEDEILDAIATHHDQPEFVLAGDSRQPALPTALRTAASIVEYFEQVQSDLTCDRRELDRLLSLAFGFTPDSITTTLADIDHRATKLAECFSVEIGLPCSLEEVLQRAETTLCQHYSRKTSWMLTLDDRTDGSLLNTAVEDAVEEARRSGWSIGVVSLQVENLDDLAKQFGAEYREQILQQAVAALRTSLRMSDYLLRFADETLIAVMIDVNYRLIKRVIERVHCRFRELAASCRQAVDAAVCVRAVISDPNSQQTWRLSHALEESAKAMQSEHRTPDDQSSESSQLRWTYSSSSFASGSERIRIQEADSDGLSPQ